MERHYSVVEKELSGGTQGARRHLVIVAGSEWKSYRGTFE